LRQIIASKQNLTIGLSQLSNMSAIFPDPFAYADACSGISLLQEAYQLDAEDLAAGLVRARKPFVLHPITFESDFKISWYEMFQIGTRAFSRGWIDTGITWFNLALEKAPKKASSKEELTRLKELKKVRATSIKKHDFYLEQRGPIATNTRTFPIPFDEKLRKKKKYKKLLNEKKIEKVVELFPLFNTSLELSKARDNFFVLCKDGMIPTREPNFDSKLFCRYQHHSNPYLRLAPFKLEELNIDPFIVVFYDFISDNEILRLKGRVTRNLQRSETGGSNESKRSKSLTRTSKQAWVHERYFLLPNGKINETTGEAVQTGFLLTIDSEYIPTLPGTDHNSYMTVVDHTVFKLTRKIEQATQLNAHSPFSSELYQVANYGIGGQYSTHFDARGTQWMNEDMPGATSYDAVYGDRVATFMGYLEDVPLGGATAFPFIGAAVQPEKGSAVFWLNLNPRGNIDKLSAHGGCPVLVGSKWITNKWIGGFDQWNVLKCGLTPTASYELHERWRQSE
jgi:prolyl 4-hydroxylase